MINTNSIGLLRNNSHIYIYKSYSDILESDILHEIDITSRLHHPYILSNSGFYSSFLLYPLSHYSLYDVVKKSDQPTIMKLPILHKIAQALSYLHDNNIIHRHIQIDQVYILNNNPLLSIFPLSSSPPDITYFAPEILNTTNFSFKTDVWSFGILMLYVLSEQGIFNCDISNKDLLRRQMEYLSYSFNSYRSDPQFVENFLYTISPKYKEKCILLLSKIFSLNPSDRPTMKEIVSNPLFQGPPSDLIVSSVPPNLSLQCADDSRELLKVMLHLIKNLYPTESAELIFLSTDLFYRVSSFYITSSPDIRTFVMLSCLYLSSLYLNCKNTSSDYIISEVRKLYPDISFTDVIKYSRELLEKLSGRININPIYSKCNGLRETKWFMLNLILSRNSSDYYNIYTDSNYLTRTIPTIPDVPNNVPINILLVSDLLKD